ncbi:MAG: asparagine synthase (glutamine-hydrolyzing), partial [Planctomycetota bacterium]|nr:asparagine synthase (glutamine-hydrolyzing) [Planctomycetota bacterium]
LGIRRLAIIDLKTGDQPIHNENKTLWIVLNGEIYNFLQLRQDLLKKGHSFYTQTDTEIIIHLYEEYGVDCLKFLHGMFAFAIWDERKGQLFLARDRLGKKPLCYALSDKYLIFASELKAILQNSEIKKEIDLTALDYYLSYYYIPSPYTIFKQIRKLPPASYLVCDASGKTRIEQYWQIDYARKHSLSEAEYCSRIMELLEESVRIRLVSDVPLGALLSGGIDSSAVVGMMAKHSSKPVKTFSIGFTERDYSELKYARIVAEYFKTEHYEFIITPKVVEILPSLVWHYSEPYADSSMLPTYYVAQETRKYVTVALNGDGGDENFAGYPRYLAQKLMSFFPVRVLSRMLNLLMSFPTGIDPKNFFSRLKRFTEVANLPPAQRYLFWQLCFDVSLRENLYQPWLKEALGTTLPLRRDATPFARLAERERGWGGEPPALRGEVRPAGRRPAGRGTGMVLSDPLKQTDDYLLKLYNSPLTKGDRGLFSAGHTKDLIDRMLYTDVMSYLPEDLLVKMDIAAMANSLETRSPFLDHKLMEFSAGIPSNLKLKGLTLKYILKRTLKGFLPEEVLTRGKMGFGVPISRWIRNELKGYLQETLSPEVIRRRGYFQPTAIQNIIQEHLSGNVDHGYRLWALLVLELWFRRFMD